MQPTTLHFSPTREPPKNLPCLGLLFYHFKETLKPKPQTRLYKLLQRYPVGPGRLFGMKVDKESKEETYSRSCILSPIS